MMKDLSVSFKVKFDDKTVGQKAKVLSQYKEQYLDAVPISNMESLSDTKLSQYSRLSFQSY